MVRGANSSFGKWAVGTTTSASTIASGGGRLGDLGTPATSGVGRVLIDDDQGGAQLVGDGGDDVRGLPQAEDPADAALGEPVRQLRKALARQW
jgi:hypothetical protein